MKADKPQYLNDRLVNVFVQFGHEQEADAIGIPSALDLVADPQDRQVVRLILANLAMSRPFVAPPKLPPERLKALRDAFEATTRDPEFLAAAKKAAREISVYRADEIDALLKESYELPKSVIQRTLDVSAPR